MKNKDQSNQVRIIAGQWRGRKINFPEIPGLRPSSDRVRETLFNWLMHDIGGSRCLDLFAGSGVLGLEALSRGATSVVAVDESVLAIQTLKENAQLVGTQALSTLCAKCPNVLSKLEGKFDLVFVDPPFHQHLVETCCETLEQNNLLSPHAAVYVEMEISTVETKFPANWELYREMKTQQVRAILFRRSGIHYG